MYIHEVGGSEGEKTMNKIKVTVVIALLSREATKYQKQMKLQLCNKRYLMIEG